MRYDPNFTVAIDRLKDQIRVLSYQVHTDRWQGMDITNKPEMQTYEVLNAQLAVKIYTEDLDLLRQDIKPNLPWADDHFLERVGGHPLNPGKEWENWPYAKSADRFRQVSGRFNHTYMQRLWPKYAGHSKGGVLSEMDTRGVPAHSVNPPHEGIYGEYGDLMDLVFLLEHDPYTRQAWIPLFFPEDTGYGDGGRKPCTLGYQFMLRGANLHIYYPLRSCDFVRHFRDDVYLAVRLGLWVLDRLREKDEFWVGTTLGTLVMHMTSLHIFKNDYIAMFGKPHMGDK